MSTKENTLERQDEQTARVQPISAQPAPQQASSAAPKTNRKARVFAYSVLALAIVAGGAAYGAHVMLAPPAEETDDAYVGGDIVSITARDGGTVLAVHADNTQQVGRGDLLIDLDPATQTVGLSAAEAALGQAVRSFRANTSAVEEASAEIAQATAELKRATDDLERRRTLASGGAVSAEEASHAEDAVTSARAAVDLAKSKREQALSLVQGTDVHDNPTVLAAIAGVRNAAIDLAHTRIEAPVSGVIAQRSVQLGQKVAAGTPLMSIVPLDSLWVDANFRETQLKDIRVGQPVTVTADVYGNAINYHGHVLGLAAGSGNAFALLPPQNASGNWIKIVQRVPVRIALDPAELKDHPLRIGLSVTATIATDDQSGPFVSGKAAPAGGQLQSQDGGSSVDGKIEQIIAQNMGGQS